MVWRVYQTEERSGGGWKVGNEKTGGSFAEGRSGGGKERRKRRRRGRRERLKKTAATTAAATKAGAEQELCFLTLAGRALYSDPHTCTTVYVVAVVFEPLSREQFGNRKLLHGRAQYCTPGGNASWYTIQTKTCLQRLFVCTFYTSLNEEEEEEGERGGALTSRRGIIQREKGKREDRGRGLF